MDEPIGAADLLRVHPPGGVEVPDVAGELHGQVVRLEALDRSDAVTSGNQAIPELLDPGADRRDRADPGDDDPLGAALGHGG
jgi:hypothetical protein